MPHLAVVIVSWNVRDLLAACLHALFTDLDHSGLEADVWVVDNGSADGTPAMVAREFPDIHLVASDENRGFAAGNNVAIRAILTHHASRITRYVWLLNPDTEVQPGATAALISALEAEPRAAVAGAKLLYPDGSLQQSAFRFPGLAQLAFEFFPLPARFYDTVLNGRYPCRLYEGETPFPVDHPLGATMMVRTETIADVGLLDEGFWMYCEEIDWCWRMHKAGWRAYCAPAAQVVHHAGGSTGQVRVASFVALWRSRLRLYGKHYPPLKRRLAHRLVRLGMRWKMRQAHVAHRRGEIGATELDARLEACQTVLTL
jgi:N-acetylglucosaminyl-diphospho-decaprenol L-rhamnosyltransferase